MIVTDQLSILRQIEEANRGLLQEREAALDIMQTKLNKIGDQPELVAIEDLANQLEVAQTELNRVNDSLAVQKNENQITNQRLQAEKQESDSQKRKITTLKEENDNLEHRLRVQGKILASERKKQNGGVGANQEAETVKVKKQLQNMQTLLDKKTNEVVVLEKDNQIMRNKITTLTPNCRSSRRTKGMDQPTEDGGVCVLCFTRLNVADEKHDERGTTDMYATSNSHK